MGTLTVLADRIPSELRRLPRWLGWQAVKQPKGRKPKKVPVNPATGRPANVNDPSAAGAFDDAWELYRAGGCDGIGFLLVESDGIVGIDLDACRVPETGRLDGWAADIVAALGSYAEVSPSGTGVRLFARGRLSPDGRRKCGTIELYGRQRYLTVTGHVLPGVPATVADRPEQVSALQCTLGPLRPPATVTLATPTVPTMPTRSDAEILVSARAAANGAKVERLLDGDWSDYPSQSEADLALCGILLFWTGGDVEQADRLFRSSGLMRPKWDHRRGSTTYGQRTLQAAVRSLVCARPPPAGAPPQEGSEKTPNLCLKLYPLLRRPPAPGKGDPLPGMARRLAVERPDWGRLVAACGGEPEAVIAAVGDALGRSEDGRFFLSAALAGRLVGAGRTWGNKLLRRLVERGVLEVLEVGRLVTRRATVYRVRLEPSDRV